MADKKSERVRQLRENANRLKKEQQAKAKRRRSLIQLSIIVGAIVVIGAIVAGVFFAQQASKPVKVSFDGTTKVDNTEVAIQSTSSGIAVGQKDAPATVDMWMDYACPACGQYENLMSPVLDKMVASGQVKIVYHPIYFIKASNYGQRAGGASVAVAKYDPQNWQKVHEALIAAQPEDESAQVTPETVETTVKKAGVTNKKVVDAIQAGNLNSWVQGNTDSDTGKGITFTPTMMINGKRTPAQSSESKAGNALLPSVLVTQLEKAGAKFDDSVKQTATQVETQYKQQLAAQQQQQQQSNNGG